MRNLVVRDALALWVLVALVATTAVAAKADTDATGDELETVVITASRASTATKTDTALVETPQAISVITANQLSDRGAQTMQETLRYSAGVDSEAYGLDTRADGPIVRGFYPVEYLDGMMKLVGYSLIPRTEVYTLDRVELLRGPSSVLYGQGNTGGVINEISKRPLFEAQSTIGLQYGSYDRKQLQFDTTAPLDSSGDLAGRIVGVYRDSDMQTDHVADDRRVLAPSLTWQAGDSTTLTFLGLLQNDHTASSQQFLPVVATLLAPPGRRVADDTFLGEPDFDKLTTRQASASVLLEHAFSDALRLNSSLRYARARTTFQEIYPDVYSNPEDPFIDADDRVVNRNAYAIKARVATLTNDNNLQFDFTTGAFTHKLLGGVDYLNFRQRSQTASDVTTPIDIYAPVYGDYTVPEFFTDPTQRQTQVGVYAQDQIRYADRVSLVLGARRDRAESKVEGSPDQVDRATTYRAGVIVDAGAGFSPYLSYSESFLPVVGLDFYDQPFKPQRGKQTEAGVKWQPRSGTLVTLAVYDITETNRQTNDPNNVLNTVQTGEVQSKGVELEASHALGRDFYLTGALSYTNAKVTRSNFEPEVGAPLSDVPKRQASLWGVKTFALADAVKLRVGAGARYVGSTVSTGVTGSLTTPSYTLADALLALDWQRWTLSINATNLFDKRYYAPCRTFGDCFTGNRRNVIGTIDYRF